MSTTNISTGMNWVAGYVKTPLAVLMSKLTVSDMEVLCDYCAHEYHTYDQQMQLRAKALMVAILKTGKVTWTPVEYQWLQPWAKQQYVRNGLIGLTQINPNLIKRDNVNKHRSQL